MAVQTPAAAEQAAPRVASDETLSSAVDPLFAGSLIDNAGPVWSNVRVLGKRLRKFSLWHGLLLRTLSSPLVMPSKAPMFTLADIQTAVAVCRTQFGDCRLHKPRWRPFLVKARAMWLALRFKPSGDPQQLGPLQLAIKPHVEAFLRYAADYIRNPVFAIIPPDPVKGGKPTPRITPGPSELETVCSLMSLGFSWEQAWNLPIGQANWCKPIALRNQGHRVDFADAAERAFQEKLPPEYRHG